MKTDKFPNSRDPDEAAHYEPPHLELCCLRGWLGGATVLCKLPVPGHPTIWITVGQGLTALAVGAGGGCLDIFTLIYPFFLCFSLSLGDSPI